MKGGLGGISQAQLQLVFNMFHDKLVDTNNKNTSDIKENIKRNIKMNKENTQRILNNIKENVQAILDNNVKNTKKILDEMKKTHVTPAALPPAAPHPSLFDEVHPDADKTPSMTGNQETSQIGSKKRSLEIESTVPVGESTVPVREGDFNKRHNNQNIDPFLGPAPQPPPATPPATPATREDDLMNMDPVVTTNLKAWQPNTATNDMQMPLLSDEQEKKEDPLSGVNPYLWKYNTNPVTDEVIDNEKWSAALNASLKDLGKKGGKRKTKKRRRRFIHKKTKHK